jgi:hypothetical protein
MVLLLHFLKANNITLLFYMKGVVARSMQIGPSTTIYLPYLMIGCWLILRLYPLSI